MTAMIDYRAEPHADGGWLVHDQAGNDVTEGRVRFITKSAAVAHICRLVGYPPVLPQPERKERY